MAKKIHFDVTKKTIIYDNIVVRVVDLASSEKTPYVDPRQYDDKPEVGEVVGVGHGRLLDNGELVPLIVKVGDYVLFNKYAATKYRNPETREELYCVREEDIICH